MKKRIYISGIIGVLNVLIAKLEKPHHSLYICTMNGGVSWFYVLTLGLLDIVVVLISGG